MTMRDAMFDVAIVGGGISGLAAAHALQTAESPLSYVVLEGSDRWGGKIQTERLGLAGTDPFILEAGPDSFITQKPWALQLARQLGMSAQLLPTNDERRQTFVLNRGRPVPLPDGVMLIVPTKFRPFLFSPLISLPGKLRMGLDWFIKPKTDGADETLADFIRRRLGNEALDKIAEPLLAGIYNAEAEKQSILATFPRFRDIETKHGSLIRGMLAAMKNRPAKPASGGPRPPSAFISFRGGMTELVTRLLAELTGDLRLNAPVAGLDREREGYRLTLANGEQISARSVILAVPAYRAATLLRLMRRRRRPGWTRFAMSAPAPSPWLSAQMRLVTRSMGLASSSRAARSGASTPSPGPRPNLTTGPRPIIGSCVSFLAAPARRR